MEMEWKNHAWHVITSSRPDTAGRPKRGEAASRGAVDITY
jgi:hypothetical protein